MERDITVNLTPIITQPNYKEETEVWNNSQEFFLQLGGGKKKKKKELSTWKSLQSSLKYFDCSIY